ncbi:tetratricopeptide repeat protein [Pedobacter jeongneungensis]|uniref:tetratricopeptide repeat protein n=1 Tax=Pedobacter jeongneungensis TaxID=947309 RepID=UPI000B26E5D1|nr:tetratricopeptide repeat protein [Pedobacter jeongneungensis]
MLATNFCHHLFTVNDYKNAEICSEEIYHLLKFTELQQYQATITKILGESLRMNNEHDRSLEILNEALAMDKKIFSKFERASMLSDIGYIYQSQEKKEKAIETAKMIEQLSAPNSTNWIVAKYIIAECSLEGGALINKLKSLEKLAQKANAKTLCNNISLSLCYILGESEQLKRFDSVTKQSTDTYNVIRAIISKSLMILDRDDLEMSEDDIRLLYKAYSYLYGQSMVDLFDMCHKALWMICVRKLLVSDLLNLFRHSSFFWRILDQDKVEEEYFLQLHNDYNLTIDTFDNKGIVEMNLEYFNRRKLELKKIGPAQLQLS